MGRRVDTSRYGPTSTNVQSHPAHCSRGTTQGPPRTPGVLIVSPTTTRPDVPLLPGRWTLTLFVDSPEDRDPSLPPRDPVMGPTHVRRRRRGDRDVVTVGETPDRPARPPGRDDGLDARRRVRVGCLSPPGRPGCPGVGTTRRLVTAPLGVSPPPRSRSPWPSGAHRVPTSRYYSTRPPRGSTEYCHGRSTTDSTEAPWTGATDWRWRPGRSRTPFHSRSSRRQRPTPACSPNPCVRGGRAK